MSLVFFPKWGIIHRLLSSFIPKTILQPFKKCFPSEYNSKLAILNSRSGRFKCAFTKGINIDAGSLKGTDSMAHTTRFLVIQAGLFLEGGGVSAI